MENERKRETKNINVAAAAAPLSRAHSQPLFNPYFHAQQNHSTSDFAATFLPAFKASNPQMEVLEEVRAGHHPYLRGEYRE